MNDIAFNVYIDHNNSIAICDETGKEVLGLMTATLHQDFSYPPSHNWARGEAYIKFEAIANVHKTKEDMLAKIAEWKAEKEKEHDPNTTPTGIK